MLQARNILIDQRPDPVSHDQPAGKQIRGKRRRHLGFKSMPYFLLAGCFLLGLVIIAQYSSMVSLHYRIARAEDRMNTLQEEYRQLEQEAARLSSLARIEMIARSELGMQEPEKGQVRILTAGRGSGSAAGE
ncbi:MAG TPA: cell division protein FtsL [Bacillota bacterium]|nr:cell division protein FtsL [Bacillota bacterium]